MAKLEEIARRMEAEAHARGVSDRRLGRGLRIRLVQIMGARVLHLSRDDVAPGGNEVAVCRRVFRVPEEARRDEHSRAVAFRWPI